MKTLLLKNRIGLSDTDLLIAVKSRSLISSKKSIYKCLAIFFVLLLNGQLSFAQIEKMEIEGAIILSNNEDPSPAAGTIRWTGIDFEGFDGTDWKSLTSCNDEDSNVPTTGIIFESDFSQDTGYEALKINNPGPPVGWDRIILSHYDCRVSVESGAGIDGGNALKMEWDPTTGQPTISLDKHLTGNDNTGYDELYIRYNIKLPNNFRASDETQYRPYWKWGRLWQNTNAIPDHTWTEQRPDSGFVVWGFGGNITYTQLYSAWSENSGPNLDAGGASAGGEHQVTDNWVSGEVLKDRNGYFENVANGAWELHSDNDGYFLDRSNQQYHTIEFRFKLATTETSDDGVFEWFVDGIKQDDYVRLNPYFGAPQRTSIPTTNLGTGFNYFSFFDNMAGWNRGWDNPETDPFVLINDVVISTNRIGHEYRVGQ